MNTSDKRRFGGISRLFGPKAFEILNHSHVVVVGVGGVGSWVAEALARTAVGHITLIDGDTVEESNTNRQLPALNGTYGQKKVEVLARRLQAINPEARIDIVDRFVGEDNFDELIPACDAIIDCIASRVSFADIAYAKGDSLIAAMRTRLRKEYGFPKVKSGEKPKAFGIGAVYSDESVRGSQDGGEGFGVFMAVTATFAMRLTQACIEQLLHEYKQ